MFNSLLSRLKSRLNFLTLFLLLFAQPAFGFNNLPTEVFDAVGYFSVSNNNISGTKKDTLDEMMETDEMDASEVKIDRSVQNLAFAFSPIKSFGVTIENYKTNLKTEDYQYEMPLGPKNIDKTAYQRTSIGVRSMFINNSSSVKVGIWSELLMNDTADQDGEAFAITPFFYFGHHLPLSLRYAYNVEASRRKTRTIDTDITSIDRFYGSHFYIRFSPYYSIARLPFAYEYYQRNGTAPDLLNFDTEKDRTIEHRIFINLPAKMQLMLTMQSRNDVDSVGLGLEIPFF